MEIFVGVCRFTSRLLNEFKTLEIQQTFYNIPARESTIRGWKEKAPKDFHWCFKVFQGITHPASSPTWRRYRKTLSEKEKSLVGDLKLNDITMKFWEKMLLIAKILDAKVMVVQTPASFKPTNENVNNAIKTFNFVLDELKKENIATIIGWEPRGDWLKNPQTIKTVLENCPGVIHIVDPFFHTPVELNKVAYFRLHGKPYLNYRYKYTDDDLNQLKKYVEQLSCDAVYIMFNNVYMETDSKRFQTLLGSI